MKNFGQKHIPLRHIGKNWMRRRYANLLSYLECLRKEILPLISVNSQQPPTSIFLRYLFLINDVRVFNADLPWRNLKRTRLNILFRVKWFYKPFLMITLVTWQTCKWKRVAGLSAPQIPSSNLSSSDNDILDEVGSSADIIVNRNTTTKWVGFLLFVWFVLGIQRVILR